MDGGRPVESTLSFDGMGQILYQDRDVEIRAGHIFEGKTVKGGKNLIFPMRVINGWVIYMHGDRAKKVELEKFVNAVLSGDLEPKNINEVDVGRLSMAAMGIDAIANRRKMEEHIEYMGEQAEARYKEHSKNVG